MYVHMCNIMRSNSCCFCVCIFILTQFSEPTSCFNEFCVLRIHELFPRNFVCLLFYGFLQDKTFWLRFMVYSRPSIQVNLCQKLFFLQNLGRTCFVQKKRVSETISVHNMFSPGLSLEFSCIELVFQWTIRRHIMGSWCKNKSFW